MECTVRRRAHPVNEGYRPIYYHEFVHRCGPEEEKRRRYWARSFLGYPPLRIAQPNAAHKAIAALQRAGFVDRLITQNVDRLHYAAGHTEPPQYTELHGSLAEVRCIGHGTGKPDAQPEWWKARRTRAFGDVERYTTSHIRDDAPGCGFVASRDALQDYFAELNPAWQAWAERLANEPDLSLRRNPDGDVQLEGVDYNTFEYPSCPSCGGLLKPDVVFFGESVKSWVRQATEESARECDAALIIGTTLATHSAYRIVKQIVAAGKPVVLLNRGPTRADPILEDRIGLDCAEVMHDVAQRMLST